MDQDTPSQNRVDTKEDYLSQITWEKFWAINGERLIWASWIKNYSDYINPDYLDDNNQLSMDENNIPKKQEGADDIFNTNEQTTQQQPAEDMRERKFSYDSKVNPYKKRLSTQSSTERNDKSGEKCNKDNLFMPIGRRRSYSEHVRMLSPRTLAGTDSMTNVTKITMSSYDMSSGHVTSESSPTDDYSVTSSSSDDPSNDQTRIANVKENIGRVPSEEQDTEEYWHDLWKKHFGEQYALHYANYLEIQNLLNFKNLPVINVELMREKKVHQRMTEIEGENSEGNSQDMPSVIEVQAQVNDLKIEEIETKDEERREEKEIEMVDHTPDKNKNHGTQIPIEQNIIKTEEVRTVERVTKYKKRTKKTDTNNPKYIGSMGYLLQNLLKEGQGKADTQSEIEEAGEGGSSGKAEPASQDMVDSSSNNTSKALQSESNSNYSQNSYNEGDDDPPDEKMLKLKRR